MSGLFDVARDLFGIGLDGAELGPVQLGVRALALYLTALLVVRLAGARVLGQGVGFDVLLGFVLGSLLCRDLLDSHTLFQTVVAAGVMLLVHGRVTTPPARDQTPRSTPRSPADPAARALPSVGTPARS